MPAVERARHSLRRRITLITLLIFLASTGALSYYASRWLRDDMQLLLANQQFSAVSYVASDFNSELEERIRALEQTAQAIDRSTLEHPAELQRKLESYPVLMDMFNAGVVAVRRDGTAMADIPIVDKRRGTNYSDNAATRTALSEGISVIGRPVIGRLLGQPLFNINVPIRDRQGEVIGALFGVINLAKPNFFDRIVKHPYGKSGAFLVIDLQHNLFVTATDFSRSAQPLPDPGRNPTLDKRRKGFLGSEISVNSLGVEVLSSASRLPSSGWLVIATLPTDEAFAPIRDLQQRIVAMSLLLSLIAGAIAWWLLRRQFEPMHSAVDALARMFDQDAPPQRLPIVHDDEIGQLVGGFNRLLGKLVERETQLEAERNFFSAMLQQASDGVLLLEPADLRIREVNPSFCRMLACEREELLGLKFSELLDAGDPGVEPQAVPAGGIDLQANTNAAFSGREKGREIVEIKRSQRDGSSISLEVATTRLCDERGVPHTVLGIARDITARRNIEEEQRRFIAMVSHEFRTPLATIDGALQRLEAGEADAATRKRYRNIQNAVDQLVVLLDDYLSLGRLDMVAHGLHLSEGSPRALLLDSQAVAQSLSSEHEITVEVEKLPETFVFDVDRMRLALHVMVNNAVNYTPPGTLIVLRGGASAKGGIELTVSDNGPGIPDDELPNVFDKFFRGRAASRQTGSGLGLYMAQKVVVMHGGNLTVSQRAEGGSEFKIWLPSHSMGGMVST